MSDESESSAKKDLFGHALYEIEHALGMYATSFCTLPAEYIYEKDALAPLMDVAASCHIYLIGYTPIVNFVDAEKNGNVLDLKFTIGDKNYTVSYDLPAGWSLKQEADLHYLEDESGRRRWPSENDMQVRLSAQSKAVNFKVANRGSVNPPPSGGLCFVPSPSREKVRMRVRDIGIIAASQLR